MNPHQNLLQDLQGLKVAMLPAEGPALSTERDASDLVGTLFGQEIDLVAIPIARLAPGFWDLRSRLAGHFIQKLQNHRLRVAFLGDLSAELAASGALRDYVTESNRRKDVLFAADIAALEALLFKPVER
jgi:hypothetical protein